MSVSNGKISAPISVREVYDCLGVKPGKSNGYDVGYICSNQHHMINMWSKKKPVHIEGALFHTTDDWWKGTDRTCGMDFTNAIADDYHNIHGKYTTDRNNGWNYLPPSGGANSPYRLEDFNGYDHNAKPPEFEFSVVPPTIVPQGEYLTVNLKYNEAAAGSTSLSLKDIKSPFLEFGNITNYYFGIMVMDDNKWIYGRVVSRERTWGDLKFRCVGMEPSEYNLYKVYPFFSKFAFDQFQEDIATKYITIPGCGPIHFKVTNPLEYKDMVITLTGGYIMKGSPSYGEPEPDPGSRASVSYTVNIYANEDVTLSKNIIYMRVAGTPSSYPIGPDEPRQILDEISLAKGESRTLNGSFPLNDTTRYMEHYLYLTLNDGQYKEESDTLTESIYL